MLVRSIQMPLSQYLPKAILGEQTQIRHSGLLSPALCVYTHDLLVSTFGHPFMNRPWVALLLSALIFTVVHISTYSAHGILMFPVSLVICWAYYRTGTIWVGFVIHCLQNMIGLSFYLVPEVKETASILFNPQNQPANGDTYLWMAEVVLICLAIFAVWRINLLTKESKITYEIEPAAE